MYTRNFFQFRPIDFHQRQHEAPQSPQPLIQHHSDLLNSNSKWKKSLHLGTDPVDNADSTGSVLNLSDLSNSNAAFIGTICLASGFVLLAIFASIYYYRKRGSYHDFSGQQSSISNHKVLLLKKDIALEKPYVVKKKTPAVRSPSSSQVNPFNKKSPSPTSGQQPTGFSPIDEKNKHIDLESVKVHSNNSTRNNSKNCSPSDDQGKHIFNPNENGQQQQQQKEDGQTTISGNVPLNGCNGQQTVHLEPTTTLANNNNKNLGKLHFKLKYSYEKRALCLVIIRCTDLPTKENGTLDPYVKMQLLPEKQHKAKTRVLRKSQNPVYNEEFTFYGITSNLLENLAVHFVVLNFDRFSRDEILGEVVCRLNQFEFDSLEKQITLCRDIGPCGNKIKIQDLGELLVSLCYQPIANRLTVVILKARNLPKMDLTGLCDPYVKIYVFHNNERISKKRTHIKKRTLSPVFNESFIFDIPPEEGLDNIRLQFMVYDHDRVTRNELIGKVEIGSKTGIPATEKHWHEVIKSPRRQIAEWHKLREVNDNSNN